MSSDHLAGWRPGRRCPIRAKLCLAISCLLLATIGSCTANQNSRVLGVPVSHRTADPAESTLPPTSFTISPNSQTRQWLKTHPNDPRTPKLTAVLGNHPDSEWITGGSRGLPNLIDMMNASRATNTMPVVVLYNIPGRDDGISGPDYGVTAANYRAWIDGVAAIIGNSPVLAIVEPDALWFIDRQFATNRAGFDERIDLLRYAIDRLSRNPAAHVYLEAGTTSGSVTPDRMADLLRKASPSSGIGFAVNVSSFAPTVPITAYAQRVRTRLIGLGVQNPRYVVDVSRNGNPVWDNNAWCNPPGRKIGPYPTPRPQPSAPGLDANLWVRAPGTSDGPCGVGPGSTGGDLLPSVAYAMIS